MIRTVLNIYRHINLEAVLWLLGLGFLLLINPYSEGHHTLCPFKNIGFEYCPGCGLGRSIALLYHGELVESLQTHPLGIPALIIILHRIVFLLYRPFSKFIIKAGGQHG